MGVLVRGLVSFNLRNSLLLERGEGDPEIGRERAELSSAFLGRLLWPVWAPARPNVLVLKAQDDKEHHSGSGGGADMHESYTHGHMNARPSLSGGHTGQASIHLRASSPGWLAARPCALGLPADPEQPSSLP